jgi:hypothetical protein
MKRFLKIVFVLTMGALLSPPAGSALRAQEQFQGDEVIVEKVYPKSDNDNSRRTLKLDLDETRVIYDAPLSAKPNWYFYLPPEANSVVQLIIQKHDDRRLFLLKAIGRGKTVGGFVLREWLDDSGFQPNSPLDESQIQHAVKSKPIYIIVN